MLIRNELDTLRKVNVFHKLLSDLWSLDSALIYPVVTSQLMMSNLEKCFAVIHFRSYHNVASLVALKDILHYQAHSMLARSLFELAVDLELAETDKEFEEKMICFHELETLKLVEASDRLGKSHPEEWRPTSEADAFHLNRADEIKERARALWPGRKPSDLKHWSGLVLKNRIKGLDFEMQQNYELLYRLMSWNAHPGTMGHLNVSNEALAQSTAASFDVARTQYSRVLRGTARRFKISLVDQDIYKRIDFAQVSAYAETLEERAYVFREAGLTK